VLVNVVGIDQKKGGGGGEKEAAEEMVWGR
jgi:hypothetical protein